MKTIPLAEASDRAAEVATVITDGGLACFPVGGAYRIAADARSEAAITRLMQSKRRARNHPTLVLVTDLAAAQDVVDGTSWKITKRIAEKLWPGPLTIVLPPSSTLPSKVSKLLARATGKIGVRISADPLATQVVQSFNGPVLLSSANLERKPGSSSAAAVRKGFMSSIDVWVDAGDPKPSPPSTIIEVTETGWKLVREGALAIADIERALK